MTQCFRQMRRNPLGFKLGHHLARQDGHRFLLAFGQPPRVPIDRAQRAQRISVGINQGKPRVKSDMWRFCHERAVGKPWVFRGVRHNQRISLQNGVRAKRNVPRRVPAPDADLGLVPLPGFVYQGDHRHRHLTDHGGERSEIIEDLLRACIQDSIFMQRS